MRARNMQALTEAIMLCYPGTTIYGIGDAGHRLEVSDHNEDDTPGVRAEQSDSDNIPEHRAIDVMHGSTFTDAQASALVARLLADPSARTRLKYIIHDHKIWERSNGWGVENYSGDDPHTNHVHFSGLASNDEDYSGWAAVYTTASVPPVTPSGAVIQKGATGETVRQIQRFFLAVFPAYRNSVNVRRGVPMVVDGVFGDQTVAWVKEFQSRTGLTADGIIGSATLAKMRSNGYKY